MKKIQLMYVYRNSPASPIPASHQFEGVCGYEIERSAGLSAFWDEHQTLLVPTASIVNVHITE